MANALYDKGRQAFLEGSIAYLTDAIYCALVDATYTPNLATDEFYSTISGSVVGTPIQITTPSSTDGVADADDLTYLAVAGASIQYIVMYKNTGSPATSPLIALWDTVTGLPLTPTGGDIIIQWDNGADKIFKL